MIGCHVVNDQGDEKNGVFRGLIDMNGGWLLIIGILSSSMGNLMGFSLYQRIEIG